MSDPSQPAATPDSGAAACGPEPQAPGVVAEAEATAASAQAAEQQAVAAPPAAAGADPRQRLLERLRELEIKLYSSEVVDQVKQLSDGEKQAFVAARLHFTSVINQLNTAQLGDIAGQLEQHADEIREGIGRLGRSLDSLQEASGWAAAVNSLIGVLGHIVPLI